MLRLNGVDYEYRQEGRNLILQPYRKPEHWDADGTPIFAGDLVMILSGKDEGQIFEIGGFNDQDTWQGCYSQKKTKTFRRPILYVSSPSGSGTQVGSIDLSQPAAGPEVPQFYVSVFGIRKVADAQLRELSGGDA